MLHEARIDNRTMFETTTVADQTRYGHDPTNVVDDLFDDAPAAVDAHLVHDDPTTAYSER